jgi:hypothetical protein
MIVNKFAILLEDLSRHLSLNLQPDENNSCLLNIRDKVEVQLELDPTQRYLIFGSIIAELSPGKFREDALVSGLKANAKPYPRLGTFAFSKQKNCLVLFEMIEVDVFSVENILSLLTPFIKKAIRWKEAFDSGRTSPGIEEDYRNLNNDTNFF